MKDSQYHLGVVSVSFRQHTPEEILEAAKAAGLSYVEWGSDVHAPCRDTEQLAKIAALQREYGIACSSYGTYFSLGKTPIGELKDYIKAAKILGTNILRLWCGTKCGMEYARQERQVLMEQCKQAAKIADEEGATLCMECHQNTYTQRLEDALDLMREVNAPCFQMYWQPFQWQSVEENLAYAKAIASFVRNIHVFQWKGQQRFSLNSGMEEWKSYLCEFPIPRTLLLEFMPDNRLLSLPEEADALRKIIGERYESNISM